MNLLSSRSRRLIRTFGSGESEAYGCAPDRRSIVTLLLGVYLSYLILFALAPFTPAIDTSLPLAELFKKKFEGLSGIVALTAWDVWTNILYFIPYGVLVVALPMMFSRAWWLRILLASVSAGLLSFGIECAQLLLPRRPSLADVGCNTLGALVGGLIGTSFAYDRFCNRVRATWSVFRSHLLALPLTYVVVLCVLFSSPLLLPADFSNWDPTFPLQLGNEPSLDRPWRGRIYLVAIYDRALTAQEIWTNFTAGPSVRMVHNRVDEGLVLFYDFSERAGDVVHDRVGSGVPVHLHIQNPARVQWLVPSGLLVHGATIITSSEPPMKLANERFSPRSELSVEAWVAPADLAQGGPARIVSYSYNPYLRNFTLAQQERDLVFRLRTPVSGANGTNPELRTLNQPLGPGVHHLAATYRNKIETFYLNGIEQGRVLLQVKKTPIQVIDDLMGQPFKWLVRSVCIFPLGILVYLYHSRPRVSGSVLWASLATALAGLTLIEGLRVLMQDANAELLFVLVATGTTFISILIAHHFTTALH